VRAKLAIPHHFGTFPGITENATEFAAELKSRKVAFREMKPGQTLTFQGSRIK
jgi:L-ascorbate metabolism protein UlaG (beta-lactamase superfamily)